MELPFDDDRFVSQTVGAAMVFRSQQWVNQLSRRGRVRSKPDGRVSWDDLFDRAAEARARQVMSEAEYKAWLPQYHEERRLQRAERELYEFVGKFPKQAERAIGKVRTDEILKDIREAEAEE